MYVYVNIRGRAGVHERKECKVDRRRRRVDSDAEKKLIELIMKGRHFARDE